MRRWSMRRYWNVVALVLVAAGCMANVPTSLAAPLRCDITEHDAAGNGKTLNTVAIQRAIDGCAASGGGTVVVPKGEFVTGSLFLRAGVNLELQEGSVLKASTSIEDFPILSGNRFEGHFQDWRAAIVNAEQT